MIEGRKEVYQSHGYTSASINTLGLFEFLFGRVEVRAKPPTGNGDWPAIWMLGTNRLQVGWPTCGETDIMENVGFDPLRSHDVRQQLAKIGLQVVDSSGVGPQTRQQ